MSASTTPPLDSTSADADRKHRILQAERRALMNRLAWAQDARDRAEERILLIAGELERIEREIVAVLDLQAGR